MSKVMAWERLHDPEQRNKLNMSQFYELMREAGYSEDAAQRMANKRGWDRLEAGVPL